MTTVPAATPPTIPPLTVATDVLLLLQAPPGERSVSVVVAPAQTLATPDTEPAVGSGFTVTTDVATAVPQLFDTE